MWLYQTLLFHYLFIVFDISTKAGRLNGMDGERVTASPEPVNCTPAQLDVELPADVMRPVEPACALRMGAPALRHVTGLGTCTEAGRCIAAMLDDDF